MIDATPPKGKVEYWVVFTQGVTHWITRWLKPNFSHIFVITRDDYNWFVLNPTRLYLQVIIPAEPIDKLPLPLFVKPTDTVVKVTFGLRDDTQQFGSLGMLNCVTWVKYILGLRISGLTPWRLYKRLLSLTPKEMRHNNIESIERVST